jgi:DNA-binding response OmpR family regulator
MNALTHARKAKNVTVRATQKKRPDGDVALVQVCDDGTVIDRTEFLLAFERSHGLGLSICREFVDRHGGEIWADVGEHGGGVFAFTLPLERAELAKKPTQGADAPLILIAQDDVAFAQTCAAALSNHYRVELVRTGDEVLERARLMRPDVVVMDVFTPHRDGLDVLRELKQAPDTAQVPVLLLANRPELAERLDPLEVGAAELLIRPFPTSLLLNRVGMVLKRARPRTPYAVPGNDPETGLFDHLGIVNRIEQERSRSRRSGRLMSVGVLKPKEPVDDRVRDLAVLVRQQLATPDVVGHLGQGVWCVVLPETAPAEAAMVLASLEALLQRQGLSYQWCHSDQGEPEERGAERTLERLLS